MILPRKQALGDCVPGKFYGFSSTAKNKFHPGDTFQLQWGAHDQQGKTPINLTLAREGGRVVSNIVENAHFSPASYLFKLYNPSPNCTLEQFNWTIPDDFDTTNPKYELGLFNATVRWGHDGIPLAGFISWSPWFYVRAKPHSPLPIGAMVGIAIGASIAIVLALSLLILLLSRRRRRRPSPPPSRASTPDYPSDIKLPIRNTGPVELPAKQNFVVETDGQALREMEAPIPVELDATVPVELDSCGLHEMQGDVPSYKIS